jgi:hypothetical protein
VSFSSLYYSRKLVVYANGTSSIHVGLYSEGVTAFLGRGHFPGKWELPGSSWEGCKREPTLDHILRSDYVLGCWVDQMSGKVWLKAGDVTSIKSGSLPDSSLTTV